MSTTATATVQTNPFPGLRPFREEEEYLFFGREPQIDAMVDKLATTRFLAVVGTSGSGKSSLVNCGLRPALHRGLMACAGTTWRMAQFRPGNDPLRAMAKALAQDGVLFRNYQSGGMTLTEIVDTTLRMSKLGLIDIYEQAQLGADVNLLVVVDQFEELFRFQQLRTDQQANVSGVCEAATAFVTLLLEAKRQTTYPIYVVLTMRSDFLGDCALFPGLVEAINAGQYLVPRMTREERREAIRGPVEVGGAEISPVLLTRLVNDVGDNPDQLSILQHALNRTWARWENDGGRRGPLDLEHYEAIGTMAHALDQHAEKAYAELNNARKQELCRKIFKALTDKATDPRGVRRPTTLGTLCAMAEATAQEVRTVIDVFRKPSRSFLMPPAEESLDSETVIDISHESLMRVWRRLSIWADGEAQSAQTYRRLAETSVLHGEGRARLWQDPDLQVALDWRAKEQPNETWAHRYHAGFAQAMSFLDASVAHRDEEVRAQEAQRQDQEAQRQRALEQAQALAKKEQQRAEEQTRASRRFRWFTIALAIAFIAALGTATWAIKQKKLATLHFLEATALGHIGEVDLSLLLGMEAFRIDDRPERGGVLRKVLQQSPRLIGFLHDHRDSVQSVAWSPDGKTLASGSKDKTIRLWNLNTSHQLGASLLGHNGTVRSVAWSPDGKTLASGSDDNSVILWDVITGHPLKPPLTGHTDSVYSVAWSPDGKILASGSDDNSIILWDVTTGQPLGPALVGHTGTVRRVVWGSDGKVLASGSDDNSIILWDVITGHPLKPPLIGHTDSVYSVAWSPDGKVLASSSKDHTIRLWTVATGQPLGPPLTGHARSVYNVTWSPDGKTLASGSGDNRIRLWDAATRQPLGPPLTGHARPVYVVAWSPDGKVLASGSEDNSIILWDVMTGQPLGSPLTGHTGTVYGVAWSPDGKTLASGSDDNSIVLWNVATRQPLGPSLTGHTRPVWSVAWSPDGKVLASGSEDNRIRLWDVTTGQSLEPPLTGHADTVWSVAWSPDGKVLVSGSGDNHIRLWNVATRQPLGPSLTGHTRPVWSVAWSPDGKVLASGSEDNTIILWDVATGKPLLPPFTGHTGFVNSVAWSPDGKVLASGSEDNTIILWDVATGKPLLPPLTVHTRPVYSVTWSPDSKVLASGSEDNIIILWDVATGKPLGTPHTGHTDSVQSVAWSPDGKTLASGSDDNSIRLWNVTIRQSVQSSSDPLDVRACRLANRNFTRAEWAQYMEGRPYRATCPELPVPKE
jgi:WD40 repeat protein/energy-coupling factor transporter ATP-binding protein EcfA2